MRKLWAVLKREYRETVRKPSFLIMTVLGPFLMAALMLVPALLASKGMGERRIAVLDGTGRPGSDMILLNEKTHVRIQGLEIRNNAGVTDGSGIRLLGACRNVQILDNAIHGMRGQNAMGITVYGTVTQA